MGQAWFGCMSLNKEERIRENSPRFYIPNHWWKTGDGEDCDGWETLGLVWDSC